MPKYEHKMYLSDGTVLSGQQCDELYKTGRLFLDGRVLEADPKFRGEYLWANDTINSTKERG